MELVTATTFTIKGKSTGTDITELEKRLDTLSLPTAVHPSARRFGRRESPTADGTAKMRLYAEKGSANYLITKDLIEWFGFEILEETELPLHLKESVS